MNNKVLLTGKPGCGKTTLVQRVLECYRGAAGGFYTREVREAGTRLGFEILTLDGRLGTLAHVNIPTPLRVSKYGVDLTFLETEVIPTIEEAVNEQALVVIDEIGPMEIRSRLFREVVRETFDSGVPILATIVQRSTTFGDSIKQRQDVRMIEVTRENRDGLVRHIIDMLPND